ncbi:MAG: Kinesin heavy chain [Alyxoria varia]|nr:MAG: Kinesin heavy chain [Alyxoria varia]
MSSDTIKVVARFRPPNKVEEANGGESVVEFNTEDTCNVTSREGSGAFTYDRVFDTESRQTDVFDFSIRHTVDDLLNGYNGTVFAYGQTGAGKSYTMMGADIDDDISRGIIPRIVEQIFSSIIASPSNIEYTVRVSYMEIYMERIRDLLAPQNDNLPVHEEKNRGVYVKGLLEIYVSSVGEVYEVMRRGGLARATAATNMNQESSRSHSIFVITVAQKNLETGSAKSGQLFLVDLAGSEKVGKTGASGQTLEEAKKINKSLSALGMVINSLTDSKATHIPYRDSKLTRILQESLGGNSRTTLIINCSPSSFNADETISTLRFGSRAKRIENKAKINAELSPTELKALLKKAQSQVTTFEDYIGNLEDEVSQWRSGGSVPKDKWTPARNQQHQQPAHRRPESRQAPPTPSRMASSDSRKPETPSRPESRFEIDRASTPSVVLERDEREEFLKRENELQDQLAEKESSVTRAERELSQAREELQALRAQQKQSSGDNERLQGEVNDFKMQVEKIQFESKETLITMDGLKEANSELTTELDDVKQQLLDAKISMSETNAVLDEKEKKKAERMAQMMAGFDLGAEAFSENEQTIRKAIDRVESLYNIASEGNVVAPDELDLVRKQLVEAQGIVRQAELSLVQRGEHEDASVKRREMLEERLANVEKEYEGLLEKGLGEEDIDDVKSRLGDAYVNRQSARTEMVEDLKANLNRNIDENHKMRGELESLQQRASTNAPSQANGGAINGSKTIQQQIADFDVMKKSLMRDLQNRCERVVELEISLDETREQYNNVLRSSNNRAQQKKMAFLERNLEQLTHVQRQLVEQNSSLKKEVAIAERKLMARNERIQSLEGLLQDSQEKLTAANHRFETQLTAVKERLEAAKLGSTRGIAATSSSNGAAAASNSAFNFGSAGSRIAKPLRGGGDVNGGASVAPTGGPAGGAVSQLRGEEQAQGGNGAGGGKRASWFFNQRSWPAGASWT